MNLLTPLKCHFIDSAEVSFHWPIEVSFHWFHRSVISLVPIEVSFRDSTEVSFRPEQDGLFVLRSGETPAFRDASPDNKCRSLKLTPNS
jgi:hypothetical protein